MTATDASPTDRQPSTAPPDSPGPTAATPPTRRPTRSARRTGVALAGGTVGLLGGVLTLFATVTAGDPLSPAVEFGLAVLAALGAVGFLAGLWRMPRHYPGARTLLGGSGRTLAGLGGLAFLLASAFLALERYGRLTDPGPGMGPLFTLLLDVPAITLVVLGALPLGLALWRDGSTPRFPAALFVSAALVGTLLTAVAYLSVGVSGPVYVGGLVCFAATCAGFVVLGLDALGSDIVAA